MAQELWCGLAGSPPKDALSQDSAGSDLLLVQSLGSRGWRLLHRAAHHRTAASSDEPGRERKRAHKMEGIVLCNCLSPFGLL